MAQLPRSVNSQEPWQKRECSWPIRYVGFTGNLFGWKNVKIVLVVPGGFDRSGNERVIPALLWLTERLARRNEMHVCVLSGSDEPAKYPLVGAQVHVLRRVAAGLPGMHVLRQWRPLLRT